MFDTHSPHPPTDLTPGDLRQAVELHVARYGALPASVVVSAGFQAPRHQRELRVLQEEAEALGVALEFRSGLLTWETWLPVTGPDSNPLHTEAKGFPVMSTTTGAEPARGMPSAPSASPLPALETPPSRPQVALSPSRTFETRRGRPRTPIPADAETLLERLASEGRPVREIALALQRQGVAVSVPTVARRVSALRHLALQEAPR